MGFGVWDLGFRVWDLGFRVWHSHVRVLQEQGFADEALPEQGLLMRRPRSSVRMHDRWLTAQSMVEFKVSRCMVSC